MAAEVLAIEATEMAGGVVHWGVTIGTTVLGKEEGPSPSLSKLTTSMTMETGAARGAISTSRAGG